MAGLPLARDRFRLLLRHLVVVETLAEVAVRVSMSRGG